MDRENETLKFGQNKIFGFVLRTLKKNFRDWATKSKFSCSRSRRVLKNTEAIVTTAKNHEVEGCQDIEADQNTAIGVH